MKRMSRNVLVMFLPIILWALVVVTSVSVIAADMVTFKGMDTIPGGIPLMLTGKLTRPHGNGPFPAVVLLHGCNGIREYYDVWAERLASWGYVTLQVDSFGPRGLSTACGDSNMVFKRTYDAYDAKSYLGGLPFVDPKRIGVMGWSQGGSTTLTVLDQKRDDSFRSAVAIYPYCNLMLFDLNAPLLILIGEKDDWTPAVSCSMRMRSVQIGHEVILKIYPDSHHGFDWEGIDTLIEGHRVLFNPAALGDAIIQVKAFLAKHLK
jgi:dienelactone hydrolase